MFLLDTNVVSELRKAGAGKADRRVMEWAQSVPSSSLYLSCISVLELDIGIQRIERHDRVQGAQLRKWLETQVIPAFSDRILAVDLDVARRCAALHIPNPRPERDALIAATAFVHGMTLVTRNVVDFADTSVRLINPWD